MDSIIHLCGPSDSLGTGIADYVNNLCLVQKKNGINAHFISSNSGIAWKSALSVAEEKGIAWEIVEKNTVALLYKEAFAYNEILIEQYLRDHQLLNPIFHIHFAVPYCGLVVSSEYLVHKRVIARVHENTMQFENKRALLDPFLAMADAILFSSIVERNKTLALFPWYKSKSLISPVPPNISSHELQVTRNKAIQTVKTDRIAFFGMIKPKKGLDEVLKLQEKIQEKNLNIETLIIGSVAQFSYLSRDGKFVQHLITAIFDLESCNAVMDCMGKYAIETVEPLSVTIDYINKLESLYSAGKIKKKLRIRLYINCSPNEVAQLLLESKFAYLPFEEGVSCCNGSFFACLALGCIVVTSKGRNTTEEFLDKGLLFAANADEALSKISQLLESQELYKKAVFHYSRFKTPTWEESLQQSILAYRIARMHANNKAIVDNYFADNSLVSLSSGSTNPYLYYMEGGDGSGKTTLIELFKKCGIITKYNTLIVNTSYYGAGLELFQQVKLNNPEKPDSAIYTEYYECLSAQVMEIRRLIAEEGIKRGYGLLFDTATPIKKYGAIAILAKEAGYKIIGVGVTVDYKNYAKRVFKRSDQRKQADRCVHEIKNHIEHVVHHKSNRVYDVELLFDNNEKTPELIFYKKNGKGFVLSLIKYSNFMEKEHFPIYRISPSSTREEVAREIKIFSHKHQVKSVQSPRLAFNTKEIAEIIYSQGTDDKQSSKQSTLVGILKETMSENEILQLIEQGSFPIITIVRHAQSIHNARSDKNPDAVPFFQNNEQYSALFNLDGKKIMVSADAKEAKNYLEYLRKNDTTPQNGAVLSELIGHGEDRLSDLGKMQAANLGKRLVSANSNRNNKCIIYCSTLNRSIETGKIIRPLLKAPVFIDHRIHEGLLGAVKFSGALHEGHSFLVHDFDGKIIVEPKFGDEDITVRGESFIEIRQRALHFLGDVCLNHLSLKNKQQQLVVISHWGTINFGILPTLLALIGDELSEQTLFEFKNTFYYTFNMNEIIAAHLMCNNEYLENMTRNIRNDLKTQLILPQKNGH